MAKKTRTELSTLAINTNLPDNTTELITPTTERSQLTDERESVVNYKDDLGGVPNAGKFLTVAVDGESLTMVDEPSGVPAWVTFVTTAVANIMKLAAAGTTGNTQYSQINFLDSAATDILARIVSVQSSSAGLNTLTIQTGTTDGASGPSIFLSGEYYRNMILSSKNNTISLDTGGEFIVQINSVPKLTISSTGAATFSGELTSGSHITSTNGYIYGAYNAGDVILWGGIGNYANIYGALSWEVDKAIIKGRAGYGLGMYVDNNTAKGLTISSGGLATFSNGIKFGGTPSPAYDVAATTLDAYEEGVWTPTYSTTGTASSVTYNPSYTFGYYTRVGNQVTCWGQIMTSTSTWNGVYVQLGGLPFSANALTSSGNITYAAYFGANTPSRMYGTNTTQMYIIYRTSANGADSELVASSMDSGINKNYMIFSISYQI